MEGPSRDPDNHPPPLTSPRPAYRLVLGSPEPKPYVCAAPGLQLLENCGGSGKIMAAGSLQSKKQEPPGKTDKGLGRRSHFDQDLRESHIDTEGK